jgi:hypothetical protein
MRRFSITFLFFILLSPFLQPRVQAASAQQTVKTVALIFGEALMRNDGTTAVAMLAPELRSHTAPTQLPALLGVNSPPKAVSVIRWAFDGLTGDATLGMKYANGIVAEHLYLHLYTVGWRITRIVPEDAQELQRAAEAAVTAFCSAAIRGDIAGMRAELTTKYAAKLRSAAAVRKVIALPGSIAGCQVVAFGGTPAGADVYVLVSTGTASLREHFVVINDRTGWRIAAIVAA